ncbi:ADP-ribose pyrophosphatase [Desulfacinum hydrothermale DSM 13146]|uniref:GDP-mannose pyrophosphatase n=1 Tax=Desulfacinum hydrothermale DSM 13146 TaxID=1121390 RepID=A0A1W1X941_9BACT|nr:NUDIX hydrolase [Desulfacinum hydrothermale]SMC20374.1 ADP-ribose pyrophosphatase [Desulfacinum hydrothermale DSM 13146]
MEERIRTLGSIHAHHFSAHLDAVRLRTGRITERIRMDHPQAAAVLPFVDDGRHVLMVRQWRYAIQRETLEIPAGKVDPGESVEVCAKRELMEETGYEAQRFLPLFRYHPAIGYSNEEIVIYAASGLDKTARRHDTDEISRVEILPWDDVWHRVHGGTITDGKTVIALSLFKSLLDRGAVPQDFFT